MDIHTRRPLYFYTEAASLVPLLVIQLSLTHITIMVTAVSDACRNHHHYRLVAHHSHYSYGRVSRFSAWAVITVIAAIIAILSACQLSVILLVVIISTISILINLYLLTKVHESVRSRKIYIRKQTSTWHLYNVGHVLVLS